MGLKLLDGTIKPAYAAYKLPIWVSGSGTEVTVYGQVRPAANGSAQSVEIQRAAGAGAAFQTVTTAPVTSVNGTFTAKVRQLRWHLALALERPHLPSGDGRRQVRLGPVLLLALAAAFGAAAPARADLEIGMEDEGLILSNQHLAPAAVIAWRADGRRRRAHPRALVGDRARSATPGGRRRASTRPITTTRATAGPTWTTRCAWCARRACA